MRAEVISVGTEILLGDIVNTNAQYLAQELASLGFSVYYQSVVGDNPTRLRELVQTAKRRSEVLIFTGGLGPTDDDLTKETVAEVFGDPLVMDEGILDQLIDFFHDRGVEMTPNNRKQAMVPKNGRMLPNPNGTAPGAFFRQGNRYAFLLPGPPREMKPMFQNEVRPILEGMQNEAIRSLVLRVVGMGEGELETKVIELLAGENPTAALYAKPGEVQVRITARAATADLADAMCAEYATLFHQILGDVIYSADDSNLEATVVGLLAQRGQTVALAESCTGGLVAQRITSVPGASGVFGLGAVTYSNFAKQQELGVSGATLRRYGAVSSQVAAEMAFGAARMGRADFGVGITGVAGPGGEPPTAVGGEKPAGLVYVAVAKGSAVHIRKLNLAGRDRDFVRGLAATHALDMLRRLVAGLPLPGAKVFTRGQLADYERESAPRRKGASLLRGVVAAVVVVAAIVLLIVGVNYASRGGTGDARPGYPTAQGLRYGTEEYAAAARAMVKSESELNPAVAALISLPGGLVEDLVATGDTPQAALRSGEGGKTAAQDSSGAGDAPASGAGEGDGAEFMSLAADMPPSADPSGFARQGADAAPGEAGQNVLLLGGEAFSGIFEYLDTDRASEITTFAYHTAQKSEVYRVCALFLMDDAEEQPDGFDPAAASLSDNASFLTFLLGAKMRSLYDITLPLGADDSYMILAAEDPSTPGRRVYLCGRAARAGETGLEEPAAAPGGAVLMPASLYGENNLDVPSVNTLYAYWMRWHLTGGVTNPELQLRAGMPAHDIPLAGLAFVPASISLPAPPASSGSGETDGVESGAGQSSEPAAPSSSGSAVPAAPSSSDSAGGELDPSGDVANGMLTVTLNGQVVTAPTASILAQICQNEAANLSPEVQKAVAIAAHSWILNQQAAGNSAPNVVGKLASAELAETVEEVAGYVLSGDGRAPAFTPWCRMTASGTNTPDFVWGSQRTYLLGVSSPYEAGRADWHSFAAIPAADFAQLAKAHLSAGFENAGDPSSWITGIERSEAGYVTSLMVGDAETSGFAFWQDILVVDGEPLLPSAAFEVTSTGEELSFTAYGEGHGCGMSLLGAQGFALDGKSFTDILGHYYPGARLMEMER